MLKLSMAKNPPRVATPAAAAKRPRGRPPKPGGRIPQIEVQRAYRARLAAAGKVVRVVDAARLDPANPVPSAIPDYDPATDGIYDRGMVAKWRDDLHNALVRIELLEEDRARWQADCARAEAELRLERQHHTNTIKDKILLQQEITALKQKPRHTKNNALYKHYRFCMIQVARAVTNRRVVLAPT
jgi:hypothetical protein